MEVSAGCNAAFFGCDDEGFTVFDHEEPVLYKVLKYNKDEDMILVVNNSNEMVYISASRFEDVMIEEIEYIVDRPMTEEEFNEDIQMEELLNGSLG